MQAVTGILEPPPLLLLLLAVPPAYRLKHMLHML
jgi:hypothetical protein